MSSSLKLNIMHIMNFIIDQNVYFNESLSMPDTVSVDAQILLNQIHHTNEYINECVSKLSQLSCICMCDSALTF